MNSTFKLNYVDFPMADCISKVLHGIIIIRFIISVVTKSVHILFKEYILMTNSYFDVKIIIF